MYGIDESDGRNSPAAKRTRFTIPRILDGKFYVIMKNTNGKIEAECVRCGQMKRGDIKSTGNFLSHYRNSHSDQMLDLENYRKGQSNENSKRVQMKLTTFHKTVTKEKVRFEYFSYVSLCI